MSWARLHGILDDEKRKNEGGMFEYLKQIMTGITDSSFMHCHHNRRAGEWFITSTPSRDCVSHFDVLLQLDFFRFALQLS